MDSPTDHEFLFDNFEKLVHNCDLKSLLENYSSSEDLFSGLQFTDDVKHNNRMILLKLPSLKYSQNYKKLLKVLDKLFKNPPKILLSEYLKENRNTFEDQFKIDVKKSTKFYDTDEFNKTKYYRTRSKRRGRVLIINNIRFIDGPERLGAQVDEENLKELFKQFNFEIVSYQNLKTIDMCNKTIEFANDKSEIKPDICFIILMSHGGLSNNKTVIVGSDNDAVSEDWFKDIFNNEHCPALRNIPKILIFHVCRQQLPPITSGKTNNNNRMTEQLMINYDTRIYSDMMICHPTVEGALARRDPSKGCWYIQLLCKVFMEYAHELDVETLLKKIDDELEHYDQSNGEQTSTFQNIAFRNCYLHPGIYEEHGNLCKF